MQFHIGIYVRQSVVSDEGALWISDYENSR